MSCVEWLRCISQGALIYETLRTERGTQEKLIEPVLSILGWNLNDPVEVQREAGNTRGVNADTFDLLLFAEDNRTNPRIAIECKAIGSSQFRLPGKKHNGVLVRNNGQWDQPRTGQRLQNRNGDGLAQLRRYCANGTRGYNPAYTIPVLTNGKCWIAFKGQEFVANLANRVPNSACLFEPIRIDDPNFLRVIKDYLKK